MLTEQATVIAVDDDGLWVETLKTSSCHACSAKSACGQHILSRYMRDLTHIKARFDAGGNTRIWKRGDEVNIGIEENALVANAILVYLLPLLCLIALATMMHLLGSPDWLVATSGLAGLLSAASFLRYFYTCFPAGKRRSLEVVVVNEQRE